MPVTRRRLARIAVHPLVAAVVAVALVLGGAAIAAPLIGTARAGLGGLAIGITGAGAGAYLAAAQSARRRRHRE